MAEMQPEDLARLFHETYERLAPEYGYKTRKASAVPWQDVPDSSKQLMIAVAEQVGAEHERQVRAEAAEELMAKAAPYADTLTGPRASFRLAVGAHHLEDPMTDQINVATATRRGVRDHNCDAAAIHHLPGTHITAAAVVDGIGNSPEIAATAALCAEAAARVAARRTATLGILAAAELITVPASTEIPADGVAVVAVAEPGQDTSIAWTGDARAYSWDGTALRQLTTDQTVGEWLRQNQGGGDLAALASHHDGWVRSSLGRCTVATVHACAAADDLILLTSDGVHDQVPYDGMVKMLREIADPQALADAIVAAAEPDETGYRDDATVIVLRTARGEAP